MRKFPNTPLISFFEDDFYAYHKCGAWPQRWDVPAITTLVRMVHPDTIIDLGCGEGRITWNLFESGFTGTILGVDNSVSARTAFQERFHDEERARFHSGDLRTSPLHGTKADLLVMGDATINSFRTQEEVRMLLRYITSSLTPQGHAIMVVYQDGILERFEKLSGAMDVVEFEDAEGIRRLLWRGVHYQDRDFRQNYFIEYQGHRFPGVLGVHRERIWESGEIIALAKEAGLSLKASELTRVDQGGAQGWPCDVLLLQMDRE
ncbi:class I SAM-dependent methyltransferase [Streptosporangium sp. NPDC049644]|uniref:class I SAM-dependent methyltransferase n=1 Tax=Streptosporangium sp. NPDC049644 TaxID=3155507 RepID=UPI00341733A8